MTTNTQLWLDLDSMTYKPLVIDTNYLPFPVYKGKIYDSPHITIVTNPVWNNGMFELTNYTLPYCPPSPMYVQLSPPQIIYVTNTVVSTYSVAPAKSCGIYNPVLIGMVLFVIFYLLGKATK